MISQTRDTLEQTVERYFELIRALRQGDEKSVEALMELWDSEGTFEFAGSPPLVATYRGAVAIKTLYKNRLNTSGMRVSLETQRGQPEEATLDVVETDVTHLRINGNRAIAGWRTVIGTAEGHGFDVAGSHLFTFEGDKIKHLRVNISPKADQSQLSNLRFDDLTVIDVGRLSLAAWPVV